ncbi:uncharacterized protein LOC126964843 isoform X3 [Leptidea sinapis]|nr:uncharacterized protein LOC126964843 isoform X3 [Leptidea sinapis]
MLALEKRERMRTGGGSFNAYTISTSSQVPVLEDALAVQTDVELADVIDSDNIPCSAEIQIDDVMLLDTSSQVPAVSVEVEHVSERENIINTPPRLTESRVTDYSAAPSQGSRNIRTRVIQEEFHIRQQTYEKSQKREEELHKLRIAEKEWMVKAAEEIFLKAKTEREAAEELLHCNRAKREEAELSLRIFKNKNFEN